MKIDPPGAPLSFRFAYVFNTFVKFVNVWHPYKEILNLRKIWSLFVAKTMANKSAMSQGSTEHGVLTSDLGNWCNCSLSCSNVSDVRCGSEGAQMPNHIFASRLCVTP